MFTFVGLLCAAVDVPFVASGVGKTELTLFGIGGQTPVHSPSTWSIVDVFEICASGSTGGAMNGGFAAVVCAAAVFVCVTAPELPGLAMRTETLTLEADGCV